MNQTKKKYSSLLAFSVVRLLDLQQEHSWFLFQIYHGRCWGDHLWKSNVHFHMYLSTEVRQKSVWMFVLKIYFYIWKKRPLTNSVFLHHKCINDSKVRRTNKLNEQHKPKIWTTAVKANNKKMKLSDWVQPSRLQILSCQPFLFKLW